MVLANSGMNGSAIVKSNLKSILVFVKHTPDDKGKGLCINKVNILTHNNRNCKCINILILSQDYRIISTHN